MTDLEIIELAARRAYAIDYGMHAKNLMKVFADEIVRLKKARDDWDKASHDDALSTAGETL